MPNSSRKLAAIVFTDIAGFTELSARDELSALKLLEQQRKLFQPIVAEFEGSWLKEMGDGLLLSFDSSLNAVRCAVELQMAARTVEGLDLRIGIHQGDIVLQGTEILGDGVNIASRIEPLAPVGGVALSEKIQQDIASHPEFTPKLLGQPDLKGVAHQLKVFCLTSHGLPEGAMIEDCDEEDEPRIMTGAGSSAFWAPALGALVFVVGGVMVMNWLKTPVLPKPQSEKATSGNGSTSADNLLTEIQTNSIAILPFEPRGKGADSIWTDGVPDEIRRHLSGVRKLKVISRKSSELLRDEKASTKDIAQRLGAYWLLTGTIQQQGKEKFAITVELQHGDQLLWSKQWDQVTFKENLFSVQQEIAREIATRLGYSLPTLVAAAPKMLRFADPKDRKDTPIAEAMTLVDRPTHNFDAWVAFRKGKQHWIQRTDEGLIKGREEFVRAIQLDDRFALAHCYLAYTDMMMGVYHVERPMVAMPRAKQSALKALSLNPNLGEAHAALGYIQFLYDWDWDASMKSFEKAIDLNPNHAFTYCWYSQYFMAKNDIAKEKEMIRKSLDREPLNPVILSVYANVLRRAGQTEEAKKHANQAITCNPQCILPLRRLAIWHFNEENFNEAASYYRKIQQLIPRRISATAGEAACLLKTGKKEKAMEIFNVIFETAKNKSQHVPPGVLVWVYRNLKDKDQAYFWMRYIVENKYPEVIWFNQKDDNGDGFFSSNRFNEIMKPVGLGKLRANKTP